MLNKIAATLGTMLVAGSLSATAWAAPADPGRFEGCLVRDAVGTYHEDADCRVHVVTKTHADGTETAHYQDKGQLPADAPHPKKTIRTTSYYDCDCAFEGEFVEVLAPSGQYSSSGPH